jgi:ABC-type branched-subunit amino acid transport system substrate-binding protein
MLNPALSGADIIIGPVYQESFKPIAEFAKSRNIRIVSPLTPIDTALSTYANVFQVPTGFDEQVYQSVTHSHFDPVQSNVVLVWERDNETSKALRSKYRSYLPAGDSTFYRNLVMSRDSSTMERLYLDYLLLQHKPAVKNLAYKVGFQPRDNQGTLLKIFHPTLENKVIVASQDEPFVSELLANLKAFSDRYKCNITVYGTASWQKFENVEYKLYYDLKLHLATPYHVDYSRQTVKDFVRTFREQYKTEPSQYAFQGHDVMLYFVSAIAQFGKKFEPCLPMHRVELLQSRYNFGRAKPNGAYTNSGVFLLRYTPWMDITSYE